MIVAGAQSPWKEEEDLKFFGTLLSLSLRMNVHLFDDLYFCRLLSVYLSDSVWIRFGDITSESIEKDPNK